MSPKRIQSLKSLINFSSAPQNEFQRRTTRLSSRVSEFDSRVTIFQPESALPFTTTEGSDEISSNQQANAAEERDDVREEESSKRSRKRIKLDSEAVVSDIEDLVYVQHKSPTHSRLQKAVKRDFKLQSGASKGKVVSSLDSPSKLKSPSKIKPIPQILQTPHPPPPDWQETYDTIKSMRSRFMAPVDTMGCAGAQMGETEPRVVHLLHLFSTFFLNELPS